MRRRDSRNTGAQKGLPKHKLLPVIPFAEEVLLQMRTGREIDGREGDITLYNLSKICLQGQGEAVKVEGAVPRGAVHIVRQLGLFELYGVSKELEGESTK